MSRPWTRSEERRAVAARLAGATAAEIAASHGRTIDAVYQRLRTLGCVVEPRRKPGELLRAVRRAWRPGRSDVDIADIVESTPQHVRRCRARLGLPCGIDRREAARIGGIHRWAYARPDGRS